MAEQRTREPVPGQRAIAPSKACWAVALLSVAAAALSVCSRARAAQPSAEAELRQQLAGDIRALSSLPEGSRVTGYPGARAARDYIIERLKNLGVTQIHTQEFPVVVPVTKHASVTVGGQEIPAYPLWPNWVRTPSTGGTITGPVLCARRSFFEDYDGKELPGSIVLLDGDRSVDWINGLSFGAEAVLFVEPEESIRRELEYKVSDIPFDAPRFWVPREAGLRLRRRVEEAEARGQPLTGEVSCQVSWERRAAWNILAFLPGSDPKQREHVTILHTYYDAISVVPDLAPGAESAGNVAALLALAHDFVAKPPRRGVLLLFTAGHFESLAGMRWFCDLLKLPWEDLEKTLDRLANKVIRKEERLSDYAGLRELFEVVRKESPEAYERAVEAIAQMEAEALSARTQREKYDRLYEVLRGFDDKPFYVTLKTGLDRCESRDRTVEPARLKYLRLLDHQKLLRQVNPKLPERVSFAFGLDLSSHSAELGIFHKGKFVDQLGVHSEGVIRNVFADTGNRAADLAAEVLGPKSLIDGINVPSGRVWRTYFPGPVAFGSELLTLTAVPAVTFATANDSRALVDSPADTVDALDLEKLTSQVSRLRQLLAAMLDDFRTARASDRISKEELLTDWATRVVGRVVQYDPQRSLGMADVPVPGCVVVCRQNPGPYSRGDVWKSYAGVRPALMEVADEAGNFEFITVPHSQSLPWDHRKFQFEAYRLNPLTGEIDFAPDRGDQGEKLFPTDIPITVAEKDVTVVVFPCVPIAVFDLLDQRSYNMFSTVDLYDARTDSAPFHFGYKVAGQITGTSYIEPVGVLFLHPKSRRFKARFGAGVAGTHFALLGAEYPDKLHYSGLGYEAEAPGALINTPYLMARDLWNLDEYRLEVLRTHGVRNDKVEDLHADAGTKLAEAAEALTERRYDAFVRHARAAWGYEARAYPSVEGTTTDITTGVLFFLFLLLPVSYFGERLLFGFPDINRQIAGFFGIFLVMFLVLALVHPAFGVTSGGPIILLAFITVALSILVISMIRARFEVELERLERRPGQGARTDVNRTNAAKQAFLLGIANMRRRKVRTSLTIVTLAALMFTVLSLTSIEPKLTVKRRTLSEGVRFPYQGVLIRGTNWGTLTDQLYKGIRNQFLGVSAEAGRTVLLDTEPSAPVGQGALLAPRSWYVSESLREPGAVEIVSLAEPTRRYIATGLVGLSPEERLVTRPQEMLLTPPTWFKAEESDTCILTEKMAEVLGIGPQDVTGEATGAPRVRVFGVELAVVGIFDDEELIRYKDIDTELLSPVDYQEESWQKLSQIRLDPTELYQYVHLDPRNVLWVTYDFLMAQGGTLRSIVYVPEDPTRLRTQVEEDLLRRHTISAFVTLADQPTPSGEGPEKLVSAAAREFGPSGRVVFATSVGETAVSGLTNILIPLAISALIVLNTMLGAVYERTREIWIYGSLGLSPVHIGALFMAESCVFATVSTVVGYLVGQVVAKLITQQGFLGGLSLNYSSYSAIYSATFTMGVVLLSTIYPARKAAQLSVPDIERIWKFPEPEGDFLNFDFPFTMGGEQALGVSIHLLRYFQDHDSQSVGNFFTANNRMWSERSAPADRRAPGLSYHLASTVWIAPFDFGISQRLHMESIPSQDPGIFLARMSVERLSGAPAAWIRMNHRFLKLLRKQFLVWRLFTLAERVHYINEAKRLLGLPVPEESVAAGQGRAPTAWAPEPTGGD